MLVLSAWGLAFSLAAHLTSLPATSDSTSGIVERLLGESRQALSINLFNKADLYFHKGVGHRVTSKSLPGPFQKWQAVISPALHLHAHGTDSAEILPWLKLAMRADPHNVDAFLVASFWATTGVKLPKLSVEILNEAQRLNPGDYRIVLEQGRLAIASHQFDKALRTFESALRLQTHAPTVSLSDPDLARERALDQAEILTFLGFLHEARGERTVAIQNFRIVTTLFPERSTLKKRIDVLETGKDPQESAQSLLAHIVRKTAEDACHDEDHDHDHDAP